jgi:hypothetical protein
MSAVYNEHQASLGAALSGPGGGFGFEGGCARNYEHGVVFWSEEGGAHEIHGAIFDKWKALGGIEEVGYALTDETATPDGVGRFNHFSKNNSIYYYPAIGAWQVLGLIRQRWAEMGWERSFLGYPKTDETATPDGLGRFTHFQYGSIYYHPDVGTYIMYGYIRDIWAQNDWERGDYGYPTSDPYFVQGEQRQHFQGGTIRIPKNSFDLRPRIRRLGIDIRNQGPRGTCSVFATTFCLEFCLTEMGNVGYTRDLSEEFQNHVANLASGRTDDGDFFSSIVDGYLEYGVAPESAWPYDSDKDAYDFDAVSLSSSLYEQAEAWTAEGLKMTPYWIRTNTGEPGLTDGQMSNIKGMIRSGVPVAIGRAHSMVIVGYEEKNVYAGGGRFLIRNSYGESSGNQGYLHQTFKFVQDSIYDAVTFFQPGRTLYHLPAQHTAVAPAARREHERSVTPVATTRRVPAVPAGRAFTIRGRAIPLPRHGDGRDPSVRSRAHGIYILQREHGGSSTLYPFW